MILRISALPEPPSPPADFAAGVAAAHCKSAMCHGTQRQPSAFSRRTDARGAQRWESSMKTALPALAAILVLGTALPALADWNEVGHVDVRFRGDREMQDVRLGGPVEQLQFKAEGSDIFCRSVRATFGNGRDREIFRGPLRRGDTRMIDLPGERRNLRGLSFQCASQRPGDASIRVVADVGRYRDDWRRNPDFDRMWARTFNWGSNLVNDWRFLGSEEFRGRRDTENR